MSNSANGPESNMQNDPHSRLRELGLVLPTITAPQHTYTPVRVEGSTAYVAGQVPKRDGVVAYRGKVGEEYSLEEGQEAIRLATLNLLAQLEAAVGLARVTGFLKVNVYVACTSDFYQQPEVANAASDLIVSVFGSRGMHARTAVSALVLPQNVPVEIDATVSISVKAGIA